MSAGVCGKRVGFEDMFGSSSPTSCSAAKRARRSGSGSDFGSGSEDSVAALFEMFPDLDPELVERVCTSHNNKVEDAIESLRALAFANVSERNKSQCFDSTISKNFADVPGESTAACSQMSDQRVEDVEDIRSSAEGENMTGSSNWVNLFVHEMMNARDVDDARGLAARILEAFEQSITAPWTASAEMEHASLNEHLQSLLNDNQILKRAIAIQHDRNLEQEESAKAVEQLKHVLSQYQEKVRSLELTNYSLKLDLQRAQGQFHSHIY